MDNLKEAVLSVLRPYAAKPLNGESYLTSDLDGTVFTVISVAKMPDKRIASTGLIVRLIGDKIIIELDLNDKQLVDALLQAGIPREQIVLAYAGEAVPETA